VTLHPRIGAIATVRQQPSISYKMPTSTTAREATSRINRPDITTPTDEATSRRANQDSQRRFTAAGAFGTGRHRGENL
jgi:hypothetical protein